MKPSIPLLAFVVLTLASPLRAATNFIVLGDDFQSKINASAPGDTLVVQAGVYPGNLNFNKALTVLRSGTNQIQLTGAVQITGTGNSSFQFAQFAGAVTVQATGTVSFSQTEFLAPFNSQAANILMSHVTCLDYLSADLSVGSGTNFQAYDSTLWQLDFTGGKTLMKRCIINKIGSITLALHNNGAFEGLRVTNIGAFYAEATVGSGTPFVAAQCSFPYPMYLTGYKVWMGYNSVAGYGTIQLTNCDSVMIGNKIKDQIPAVTCSGGTLKAYNNVLSCGFNVGILPLMVLDSTVAEVVNNTFYTQAVGISVRLVGTGAAAMRSNVMRTQWGIDNLIPTLTVAYCCFDGSGAFYQNVVPTPGSISASAQLDGANYTLVLGSPCINAGPPDAIYNDRDGSRNDMGYTGGPYWNPANYTNDNPMVFFLTGSPQTVLKGIQTNIQVNAAASAGH